jgi:hypothetical protein
VFPHKFLTKTSLPSSKAHGRNNPMFHGWAELRQFDIGSYWSICRYSCHSYVINGDCLSAFLLLYVISFVKPMYEAITGNFSTLAKLIVTDGSTLMIAGDLNILHFSAIALILVFLTVRITKKKYGSFFKSFMARSDPMDNSPAGRFFERQHIPALKKCPHCAEQLQLSALICDACDYNFLSGMVGRGQKLLPSPEPMTHEMSDQSFASAGAMR